MDTSKKACSRCHEFKSRQGFYKQGDRYESLCKDCKRKSRSDKQQKPAKAKEPDERSPDTNNACLEKAAKLGLNAVDLLEIANFFNELLKMK